MSSVVNDPLTVEWWARDEMIRKQMYTELHPIHAYTPLSPLVPSILLGCSSVFVSVIA
ncbi:MAG: hypothetical protein RLP97_31150 [Coleofasciculus chthonoplastes F2-STO-03]